MKSKENTIDYYSNCLNSNSYTFTIHIFILFSS